MREIGAKFQGWARRPLDKGLAMLAGAAMRLEIQGRRVVPFARDELTGRLVGGVGSFGSVLLDYVFVHDDGDEGGGGDGDEGSYDARQG